MPPTLYCCCEIAIRKPFRSGSSAVTQGHVGPLHAAKQSVEAIGPIVVAFHDHTTRLNRCIECAAPVDKEEIVARVASKRDIGVCGRDGLDAELIPTDHDVLLYRCRAGYVKAV